MRWLFYYFLLATYRNAIWPEFPLPGNQIMNASTTYEAFETGLQARPKGICLGFRPVISTSPLKYADAYSWLTYEQVGQRRYNLGSAIEGLFRAGKAGGGELPTVGIWCINRPGKIASFSWGRRTDYSLD
jgi:long-chain acyl-CoA synthetase